MQRRSHPLSSRFGILIALLVSLALSNGGLIGAMSSFSPYGGDASAARANLAEWTVLVYLDADNNLESYGIDDMNEMEMVGSTAAVNIVVQIDRADEEAAGGEEYDDTSNGDWTGAKRYYITQDRNERDIGSNELADLGEVNMGDPAVLSAFLSWGIETYPAKRYAVVLWDHGGAFWGVCWDDTSNDYEGDALSMPELETALATTYEQTGVVIDIVGFDACLMAEMAVLYQLKDYCRICCASGYVVPGDGWPYHRILDHLVQYPGATASELGVIIAEEYVDDYTDRETDNALAVTMTAFDLSRIEELGLALDSLAMQLAEYARFHNGQIRLARTNTEGYDMEHVGPFDFSGYCMYDVVDLASQLSNFIPGDSGVRSAAQRVIAAADATIVYAAVDRLHERQGAHGLTLYFPSGDDPLAEFRTAYDTAFDELSFAKERYWDEFLHAYHQLSNVQNTPPSVYLETPRKRSRYDATEEFLRLSGLAYDAQENPQVQIAIVRAGNIPTPDDWRTATVDSPDPGEVAWEYELDIGDMGGEYTVYVRAKDRSEVYSSTLNRDFAVEAHEKGPQPVNITVFLLAVVAILAVVGFAALLLNAWRKERAPPR